MNISAVQPFIGNSFRRTSRLRTLIKPFDGQRLVDIQEASPEDVNEAVKLASDTQWGHKSDCLNQIAAAIDRNLEELAYLETVQVGKPIKDSRVEVAEVANTFRYYAGSAEKVFGRTAHIDQGFDAFTLRQPLGVCGIITSYNYPLMLTAWKLAPCLACGNTAIVKPHQSTPLTALKLAELSKNETDLPSGVLSVLPGGGDVGNAISSHLDIAKVSFTGSGGVRRLVMKAAADSNFKRVTLELGGKNPLIVFPDADLDKCVEDVNFAIFTNAGQNCCAGSRLFVHESVYVEFVSKLRDRVKKIVVNDDPLKETADFGPLIDKTQFEKTMGFIERAKKAGVKVLTGGNRLGSRGFYIEPTIFHDVDDKAEIACEEIFGPVLSVLKPFHTTEEVIERANATEFGLAGGVWSSNINTITEVQRSLKCGTLWVNCYNYTFPQMPFGGLKESGFGYDLGEEATIQEYTVSRAVIRGVAH